MITKAILLAGGEGTRLFPTSTVVNKHLLTVYGKPMIYYPLAALMRAGIRQILLISGPEDIQSFRDLLGSGEQLGIDISYQKQMKPRGIPDALIIGEEFIGGDSVCLMLGDGIFLGELNFLRNGLDQSEGATIFPYRVSNPGDYGVVYFDDQNQVLDLKEKPKNPESKYIIPGLYVFNNDATGYAKKLSPSDRGELEILDLLEIYLKQDSLFTELIPDEVQWMDLGEPTRLSFIDHYLRKLHIEENETYGYLEEVAYRENYISQTRYRNLIQKMPFSPYRDYLESVL